MADWIDFAQWKDCARLERPGYAFEVVNGEGLAIMTACADPLPLPPDWRSPPVRFRLVEIPKPRRSEPLPPAGG